MATDRSTTATTRKASHLSTERTAFKAGDKVEYDGQLAKVVNFGFLELPSLPGQDTAVSDSLVAHLQLPALSPGGKPEYAYYVPADAIKSLADNPKRQASLEREFNALFGDPVPADPDKEAPAPKIRKAGERTAEPATPRAIRQPIDMAHATGADKVEGTTGKAKTVKTSDTAPKAAKAPKATKSAKKAR